MSLLYAYSWNKSATSNIKVIIDKRPSKTKNEKKSNIMLE